ncbi:MAG: hypothetical protein HPY44_21890 [Armatimonadetes bacterium]|nr:hypothetical protein [Armatimonadota bacterium]
MQPDNDVTPVGDSSPDPSEGLPVRRDDAGGRNLRRRAGCIWGCLTEPLVILGATILAAVLGRAYLVRKARRLRKQARDTEPGE